ncbi:MAG TPA: RNA pseudouridine synthase, partial [Bacteroidetes bacterium]|nr:RNA pseudouridine synthase [Bacteroidota bacterium]
MNSSQVNDLFQESQQIEIVVPAQKVPERIDKFLIREIANISRTRLQQLIGLELVLVDGKVIKPSHTVLTGEKIAVTLPRLQKTEVAPQNIPLNILYEDEFLL